MKLSSLVISFSLTIVVGWFLLTDAANEKRVDGSSWVVTTAVSHRGLHTSEAPENSLAAFQNAVAKKFAIELDVRLAADGQVIVFHDANFKRMCGVNKSVTDVTYKEAQHYLLKNTDQQIPLLKDVLKFIDGRVPIYIELKATPGSENELASQVHAVIKGYQGPLAVISFNPIALKWFRVNAPNIIRGQTACSDGDDEASGLSSIKKFSHKYYLSNWQSKPDFYIYSLQDLPNFSLEVLHKIGKPLLVWGVENEKDLATAKATADNFMFDKIANLLSVDGSSS